LDKDEFEKFSIEYKAKKIETLVQLFFGFTILFLSFIQIFNIADTNVRNEIFKISFIVVSTIMLTSVLFLVIMLREEGEEFTNMENKYRKSEGIKSVPVDKLLSKKSKSVKNGKTARKQK